MKGGKFKAKKLPKRFIVKVQMPLMGDMGNCLVYNKGNSKFFNIPIDENIIKQMNGRKKAFFWAATRGKTFYLGINEAPWQDW